MSPLDRPTHCVGKAVGFGGTLNRVQGALQVPFGQLLITGRELNTIGTLYHATVGICPGFAGIYRNFKVQVHLFTVGQKNVALSTIGAYLVTNTQKVL